MATFSERLWLIPKLLRHCEQLSLFAISMISFSSVLLSLCHKNCFCSLYIRHGKRNKINIKNLELPVVYNGIGEGGKGGLGLGLAPTPVEASHP